MPVTHYNEMEEDRIRRSTHVVLRTLYRGQWSEVAVETPKNTPLVSMIGYAQHWVALKGKGRKIGIYLATADDERVAMPLRHIPPVVQKILEERT